MSGEGVGGWLPRTCRSATFTTGLRTPASPGIQKSVLETAIVNLASRHRWVHSHRAVPDCPSPSPLPQVCLNRLLYQGRGEGIHVVAAHPLSSFQSQSRRVPVKKIFANALGAAALIPADIESLVAISVTVHRCQPTQCRQAATVLEGQVLDGL